MSFKTWLIDKINAALPDPRQPVKAAAFREAAGATIDADEDQWRKLTGHSKRARGGGAPGIRGAGAYGEGGQGPGQPGADDGHRPQEEQARPPPPLPRD